MSLFVFLQFYKKKRKKKEVQIKKTLFNYKTFLFNIESFSGAKEETHENIVNLIF